MNSSLPESSSIVLVAIIPTRKDLEIARVLGWYRIPIRSAPKMIQVDYFCFYQPASFGEQSRWRVETFAAMRGVELVQRKDLFQDEVTHPRAHDEYYKIQLGPLLSLPKPILAGPWQRFTFLYTTGERLRAAQELKDLVVKDEERLLLWHSLREKARAGQSYQANSVDQFPLDAELLRFFTGLE